MPAGMLFRCRLRFVIGLLAVVLTVASSQAQATFSNNNPITIPVVGTASTYPSSITVSGYTGTITGITVTLTGLTHTWTDDLAVLFVGPAGQKTILFNGAGADLDPGTNVTNINLTFDDTALTRLPENDVFGEGEYRPGLDQYIEDSLAAPAPPRSYDGNFNSFLGQTPDGTYSVYIEDFIPESVNPSTGSLAGWSITMQGITPVPEPVTLLVAPALVLAARSLRRRWRASSSAC
ncbi:MAG TPA: hypothetical protein VM533_16220 [Fimbriiglobus sp.]|nr:hypothetical protein [Fimbriiglobus sp.]